MIVSAVVDRWGEVAAKLAFWLLASLTVTMLALQFGISSKELKFTGPFAAENDPAQRSLILPVPRESLLPWWSEPLIADSTDRPFKSRLTLRINDSVVGPPHMEHADIRAGRTRGFSHWNDHIIFALPPGVSNDGSTTLRLRYSIEPRPSVVAALLISTLLLGLTYYREALRRLVGLLARTSYFAAIAILTLGLSAAVAFVASSIFALFTGWALPTTAAIRWWPIAGWAARNEPYLPYILLTLAGFGALTTWISHLGKIDQSTLELYERRTRAYAYWCGFPIAICAYLYCVSAKWSGLVRPGDLDFFGIGALLPFSDAMAYVAAAFDQARDGTWNAIALNRPFAAAFRSGLLLFSQYSLTLQLLLQAVCSALLPGGHRVQ